MALREDLENLTEDIRALEKINDFEDGNGQRRDHLNKIVTAVNGIKEAFDRFAPDKGSGEIEGFIVDGGESAPYRIQAERV